MKDYYTLTKPGIIKGNLISAIAGFLFATKNSFDIVVFLSMLSGLSLVIASACVFNNIIDQKIDKKMQRTQKRAMVTGSIEKLNAIFFGFALGLAGFTALWLLVNPLASLVAMLGFFFYVVVYTYSKRITVSSTLIGSISGAIPPVVGYVAVSNILDVGALLLFLILTFWQMPHFYAISIFRKEDYKAASIPVLSIVKGVAWAKKEIMVYIMLFLVVSAFPYFLGYRGIVYLVITLGLGMYWFYKGLRPSSSEDKWARKMFGGSLIVMMGWCGAILADLIVGMVV